MPKPFARWAAPLLLGAGGCLVAASALFSEGSSEDRLVWLGLAALALAGTLGAGVLSGLPRPAPGRAALVALGLFAAFVCWNGISVLWSIEADRSWDYFNRGLVYLAFGVVGLALGAYVPRASRVWAFVLSGAFALALGWALLGKAVPALGSESGRIARLSSPIGYWNALALLFDMALPLALWLAARREHAHWLRAAGVVYVYALVVGLLLTYSRGGVLVAAVAVALWLVLGMPRVESAAALLLGGGAGLGVAVWAFSRPGLSEDLQAHSVRVHDGAWFAVVFSLAAVAVGAVAYAGSLVEERRPLTAGRRQLVGRAALGVLAVGASVAVIALVVESKPQGWFRDFTQQPTNPSQTVGPGRLANISSTSRWQWWKEAWHAFEEQPLHGTGAGTFELTHRLLRSNSIVVTEPHNVPLQFLSETGIVGFLLALGSVAAAGVGVLGVVRGLDGPDRVAAIALGVLAVAYLLHSILDFDWDFVAVSGPFFLTVGVLLGGRAVPVAERRAFLAPLPAVLAIVVALSLLTPWFAERATRSAIAAIDDGRPVQAVRDARDARSLNPLSLDPLFTQAAAEVQLGDLQVAGALYVRAVRLQPLNWWPWYRLGLFQFEQQQYEEAIPPLRRAIELDPQGSLAPELLKEAQAQVG
jgi:O-Antigen ligase/Tetratricopeptide repeat